MKDTIQVHLSDRIKNRKTISEYIQLYFSKIIDKAIELKIWSTAISSIIVTDDFIAKVEKQAKEWGVNHYISKEKEYSVISKIIFNQNFDNPEYIIIYSYKIFIGNKLPNIEIPFGQILKIYSDEIIPKSLKKIALSNKITSFDNFILSASIEWCKEMYTKINLGLIVAVPSPLMPHSIFLLSFKRKLKRLLFEFNSDKYDIITRNNNFRNSYFESVNQLILRIIENYSEDKTIKLKPTESSQELIYLIIDEIFLLSKNIIAGKEYNNDAVKKSIKNFSSHFNIKLEEETKNNYEIQITKNPKEYFVNELVDTEPRIVCFMDILGFKKLIDDYDSDMTSTVLQDIQESFAQAKKDLMEAKLNVKNENLKFLKYQTFSDNILISIPFFDNEFDFISNFNLLTLYVRGFQFIMMKKGIFMRGGISMGSFYTDDNIIFSKALVNAYLLESKKAIYPRVIIDKKIIIKLLSYNKEHLINIGLEKAIVIDWEGSVFLNPFNIFENSIKKNISKKDDTNLDFIKNWFVKEPKTTTSIKDLKFELLNSVKKEEKEGFERVKQIIYTNLIIYYDNEKIASKYLWLNEFIKWLEQNLDSRLKFDYLKSLLDLENEKG